MLNQFLKRIYFRIYISKYLSCLQTLSELYAKGDKNSYLRKMEVFYTDLVKFLQLYNKKVQFISTNEEMIEPFSMSPEDGPNNFYASHVQLLFKLQQLINSKDVNGLNSISYTVGQFLEKLYDLALPGKRSVNRKRYSIAVGILVMLALAGILYSPLKTRYTREKETYSFLVNEETYKKQTIKDIFALKEALQKYYNDNKSYPKSRGTWNTKFDPSGQPDKDWIPGLAPKYIRKLPVDPRKSMDPIKQYMYQSDGVNFKLIAHFATGMNEIINKRPELIDSVRPSWAFGVWSPGAKAW